MSVNTKMFKVGSFEEELYSSMKKELISNQLENKYSLNKLGKAAEYIGNAAQLLDDTGFKVEADMLTKVLKRLANEEEVDSDENNAETNFEAASEESPDEIIMEPLEQEIPVVAKAKAVPQEMLQFQSIANRLAAKLAASKSKKKA